MTAVEHGPDCEGPDEDGDWLCPISSNEPGLCPSCLHKYGVETEMTKTWVGRRTSNPQPEKIFYLCYLCAHGC
jgi:hypothetical protein